MSQIFRGHLALLSLGLLATTAAPSNANTAQPETVISPAARGLQLAANTDPKNASPPTIDLPKKQGAPAGPSKSGLTPPPPNQLDQKKLNPKTNFVAFNDPQWGELKVTPEARAAYLSLPPSFREQLSDPKGGAQVSTAALQKLASRLKGFKPPNLPAGVPCGPPGTVGSDFVSDGKGGCTFPPGVYAW